MRIAFEFERRGGVARAAEARGVAITQNASMDELMAFFGLDTTKLPFVNAASAMKVPAVAAAVTFLSRTLATLDLAAYRDTAEGPQLVGGKLQTIVRDAPNPEWSSWAARAYFWQSVFLYGRGLFAILRSPTGQPVELWPMDPLATRVSMDAIGRKTYTVTAATTQPVSKTFVAADVIDVPFMLASNMVNAVSPLTLGEKAIQLALAMNDYGATFFAGGGVPPLAMEGALPAGGDALKRAMGDIHRAIDAARQSDKPVFPMPPGYKLTQVGYDPAKGQMTEARLFQIQEIGRVYQLPPVFLGDLSKATMQNAEQQDLQLVKHLIGQWATALEQEANLKLFGQMKAGRYIRHDLDSLMRGDFLSRMQALGQGIQNALITPDEGRRILSRPPKPGGDQLFMQGATMPITKLGGTPLPPAAKPEAPPAVSDEGSKPALPGDDSHDA